MAAGVEAVGLAELATHLAESRSASPGDVTDGEQLHLPDLLQIEAQAGEQEGRHPAR
jgi:hypothetical protein